MVTSGKQVKDALGRGAVLINGDAIGAELNGDPGACFTPERALHGRFWLVRLGKKKYHLFVDAQA
jgi:tyrosyl-tRNA synthetase